MTARTCPTCGIGLDTDGDGDCAVCGPGPREEAWLLTVLDHLNKAAASARTPEQIAQAIHQAMILAEAEKYATEESRFIFGLTGASSEEIAEIWRNLTPFERTIVVIEAK